MEGTYSIRISVLAREERNCSVRESERTSACGVEASLLTKEGLILHCGVLTEYSLIAMQQWPAVTGHGRHSCD